ncbi:MAG: hypothetical protein IPK71_02450 [Myxococcales bacterium]|nr:hypothetical protein [Myxococcales bacterium]
MRAPRLVTAIAASASVVALAVGCTPSPSTSEPVPSLAAPRASTSGASGDSQAPSASAASVATIPASPQTPEAGVHPSSTTCTADDECALSTFPGCCSCCPCAPIKATTKADLAAQERTCAVKECESCANVKVKCAACVSPAREGMRARCIDHACTLVETRASRVDVPCTSEDDCWLDDEHRPVARPRALRGKRLTPCKGTEHTPVCEGGVCGARHWKC